MKRLLASTTALSVAMAPLSGVPVFAQTMLEDGSVVAADGSVLCTPTAEQPCDLNAILDAIAQANAAAQAAAAQAAAAQAAAAEAAANEAAAAEAAAAIAAAAAADAAAAEAAAADAAAAKAAAKEAAAAEAAAAEAAATEKAASDQAAAEQAASQKAADAAIAEQAAAEAAANEAAAAAAEQAAADAAAAAKAARQQAEAQKAADAAIAEQAAAEAAANEAAAAERAAADAAAVEKAATKQAEAQKAADAAIAEQAAADAAAAEARDANAAEAAAAEQAEAQKAADAAIAEQAAAEAAAAEAKDANAAEAAAAEQAAALKAAEATRAEQAAAEAAAAAEAKDANAAEAAAAEQAAAQKAAEAARAEQAAAEAAAAEAKDANAAEAAAAEQAATQKAAEDARAEQAAAEAAGALAIVPEEGVVAELPVERPVAVPVPDAAAVAELDALLAAPTVAEEAAAAQITGDETVVPLDAGPRVLPEAALGAAEERGPVDDGTAPAADPAAPRDAPPPAEPTSVVETVVTEADTRSSDEEFVAAPRAMTGGRKSGLSDLEKVGLVALGALVVGAILSNGRQVVENTGDRVVVRDPDGRYVVYKDDDALLRRPGVRTVTESYQDGSTRTVVDRADGSQIVTIRDASGRVLRRAAYDRLGRELVLIDDLQREVPIIVADLPAPRPSRVTISTRDENAGLKAELAALEAESIGRKFSLRQIREIREVRALSATIEVDNITFDTGSSVIRATEAPKLADLGRIMGELLTRNPGEVFLIEGHTDATGGAAMNLALSDRRAESVALALTEYFEIPPENLVVQGYGEGELRIDTQTEERANRRATIRLITPLMRQASN